MKVTIKQEYEVSISPEDLGREIMNYVYREIGEPDDAGCDWYTDAEQEGVFIANNPNWKVSDNYIMALLVDCANYLISGGFFKLDNNTEE